jgi:ribosome biogenesis protein Nip4
MESYQSSEMRPLTDEEMRIVFEKLQSYIGTNIAKLIDREDEPYTFRLVKYIMLCDQL